MHVTGTRDVFLYTTLVCNEVKWKVIWGKVPRQVTNKCFSIPIV